MTIRTVAALLLVTALVTGLIGGVTADESYDITVENGEVSIPERTETIAGYEFTVDSIAPISEGEPLDVTTTAPAGEFYFASLYDSSQDLIVDTTLRGPNSTSFDTAALDLDPGTYAVAIVAGGPEAIQPVVIEAYQMSLSASGSVEQGANITADITLDGADPEPASVDVIIANESINQTTTAQKVTDQTYEAEIPADYAPGEYRLYAVARETTSGSTTDVQDILSMSDENTLEITESAADTGNDTESSTADGTAPNSGGGSSDNGDGGSSGDSGDDGGSAVPTATSIGYADGTFVSSTQSPGSTTEYLVIEIENGSVTFGPQTDTEVRVHDISTGEMLTLSPTANSAGVTASASTEESNDLLVIRRSGASFGQFSVIPRGFAGQSSTVNMAESGATELLNTTSFGPFEVSIVGENGVVQAQTQAVPHGIRQPKLDGEFNSTHVAIERPNGFESSWQADLYPTADSVRNDTPTVSLRNEEGTEFLHGAVRLNNSDDVRINVLPPDANPEASAATIVDYESPETLNLTRVRGPVGVSKQDTDEGDTPENQTRRALQITGKGDPSELTQNDVTAVITRFNRDQSVNNININQDDVTVTITLFERN